MIEYLTNLAGRLGHWGYAIIFVLVTLECQPILALIETHERKDDFKER